MKQIKKKLFNSTLFKSKMRWNLKEHPQIQWMPRWFLFYKILLSPISIYISKAVLCLFHLSALFAQSSFTVPPPNADDSTCSHKDFSVWWWASASFYNLLLVLLRDEFLPGAGSSASAVAHGQHSCVCGNSQRGPVVMGLEHGKAGRGVISISCWENKQSLQCTRIRTNNNLLFKRHGSL